VIGGLGLIRLAAGAKNSSLTAKMDAPSAADARSITGFSVRALHHTGTNIRCAKVLAKVSYIYLLLCHLVITTTIGGRFIFLLGLHPILESY
jgi:hypothetical protein